MLKYNWRIYMYFLIGVIILIVFVVGIFIYIKVSIGSFFNKIGLSNMDLGSIISEARLEDQDVPKSLASMDSIYLERIKHDFPDININELKRKSEEVILNCLGAIEKRDSSSLKGSIKEFCDSIINDNIGHNVSYDNIKIHNTVISDYKNDNGVSTIYFSSSVEYYLNSDGKRVKIQDRFKCEFIYVYDTEKVDASKKVFGIRCPNCGSPITSLGEKSCSYCGGVVRELIGRIFTCINIVRY